MKRSTLQRKSPLRTKKPIQAASASLSRAAPLRRAPTGLRSRAQAKAVERRTERRSLPGFEAFVRVKPGPCQSCKTHTRQPHPHHVIREIDVTRAGGDPFDPRNRMILCPVCHDRHHSAFRKVSIERVPAPAFLFALALFGVDGAADYFIRRYRCE